MSAGKHPLQAAAEEADVAYSKAIVHAGAPDRWTAQAVRDDPAVKAAYEAKVAADEAWLKYMREGRR